MPPLVTAIIPVHNRAWCVRRAVESVLAQDYRPLELIVVDDGSDDATPEILAELERENASRQPPPDAIPMQILRQENQGVSAARNLGIRKARGEWIALLDSDDAWLPEKTSRQIAHLLASPGLRVSQTDETWIRNGVRVNPPARLAKAPGEIFEQSLDHCAISPSAVVLARELLDEVGLFDETYPACEDYEMWLRIACRYQVGLLPEALTVKYGGHADQLSRTTKALDRYRIRAIVKLLDSGPLTVEQRALALDALGLKCRIYAQGCLKRGREAEAREILALPARYA